MLAYWTTDEEKATLSFTLAKTLIKMRDSPAAFVPVEVFEALEAKFPKFKQQDPQEVHQEICHVITEEEENRLLNLHQTSAFLTDIEHSIKKIYKCSFCGAEGKGLVEKGYFSSVVLG